MNGSKWNLNLDTTSKQSRGCAPSDELKESKNQRACNAQYMRHILSERYRDSRNFYSDRYRDFLKGKARDKVLQPCIRPAQMSFFRLLRKNDITSSKLLAELRYSYIRVQRTLYRGSNMYEWVQSQISSAGDHAGCWKICSNRWLSGASGHPSCYRRKPVLLGIYHYGGVQRFVAHQRGFSIVETVLDGSDHQGRTVTRLSQEFRRPKISV